MTGESGASAFDISVEKYRRHVNPLWEGALREIGLLRSFVGGEGAYLIDSDGTRFLDMVGGYGAAVLGHGHPALTEALSDAVRSSAPGIVPWGICPEAGELASRLISLAANDLEKVHFASGGAEAIETALKFAAAATGRNRFVALEGGFHGLSAAATGLSGGVWATPFPKLWPDVFHVTANDLGALERRLNECVPAAIVIEVLQGTGGAQICPAMLGGIGRAARAAGSLVIVDEVMTGLGRTGEWFASCPSESDFRPDMLVVSKALTGGVVPVSAVLMTDSVFDAVFANQARAKIHGSTFSGSRLAMHCGIAVLDVMRRDNLLENVRRIGSRLVDGARRLEDRELIAGVRGSGLMLALEIVKGDFQTRAAAASQVCFGLMERGILTSVSAHDTGLLRLTPPFVLNQEDCEVFLEALEEVAVELAT